MLIQALDVCAHPQAAPDVITRQSVTVLTPEARLKEPVPRHFEAKHRATQANRVSKLCMRTHYVLNCKWQPTVFKALPRGIDQP